MSENGEEEAKVIEVPEEPGKSYFISHINSYTGKTLYEQLKNADKVKEAYAAHTFQGTIQSGTNHIYIQSTEKPEGVEKVVKMERSREFRDSILESDVIIYDLNTNEFEEVDYVIKTLKTSKLTKEKTLIILSSVMTWVNTPPKVKVEGEEEEGAGEEGGEGGGEEEGEPSEPDSDDVPAEEGEGEGEGEAPKKVQIQYFKESDAHLRVPH